ncbi:MAG: Lon protease family protein [Phycisphaerae bacterium]
MSDEQTSNGAEFEEIVLQAAEAQEPIPIDRLRLTCPAESFPFESTDELEPLEGVIGQEIALDSLRFGLAVQAQGQNIFVRGLTGTGRMTLVRRLLEDIRPDCPDAQDRCYVHNFKHPDRPRLISLPRGKAYEFEERVNEFVDFVRSDLHKTLASERMQIPVQMLERESQERMDRVTGPFEQSLREAGLALLSVKLGQSVQAVIVPTMEGRPLPPEEFQKLRQEGSITDEQAQALDKKISEFQGPLREVMNQVNTLRREYGRAVQELQEEVIRNTLTPLIQDIQAAFPERSVAVFLKEVVDDVVTRRSRRASAPEEQEDFTVYEVNTLASQELEYGCPIVVENTPTVSNLLGAIDFKIQQGAGNRSDHTMIRAGSILRADGGYLILEAREMVRETGAWKVLLRTLRTGLLEIVPSEWNGPFGGPALKPEPIPVNLKVVLLGDAGLYYMLDAYDPDFPHLFKVLADFESEIERNDENQQQFARVLARIGRDEELLPFEPSAVGALVEHSSRIAGRQDKISTRFGRLSDIAREACFVTRADKRERVQGDDVRAAVLRTRERASLPSRRFQELLASGTIRVSTDGHAIGQINGMAVTQAGPLTFGFPARITATIGPGSAGVINIEREANLSGAVHTKGFYILGGLLRTLLRTEHPLAFDASIAFEQSYGGIDGDSASGAEMCCLLSALTGIALRQDIAMTGAIDQVGNILAIGAANEKIEGFYDTCRNAGLTGTQGAIIPQANAADLMLRTDVVEACREGKFHVYAVSNVKQAIEILTGVAAGERGDNDQYPFETVLGLAVIKAYEYWLKAVQGADWARGRAVEEQPEEQLPVAPPMVDPGESN